MHLYHLYESPKLNSYSFVEWTQPLPDTWSEWLNFDDRSKCFNIALTNNVCWITFTEQCSLEIIRWTFSELCWISILVLSKHRSALFSLARSCELSTGQTVKQNRICQTLVCLVNTVKVQIELQIETFNEQRGAMPQLESTKQRAPIQWTVFNEYSLNTVHEF